MRKKWVQDVSSWEGFNYLKLKNVPMKLGAKGPVIDFDLEKIKRLVAVGILTAQIPIGGRELKLLRSVLGISMNKFARELGISYGAIYHWEKALKQRLSPVNEIAVRLLCAEKLGQELHRGFSQLIGNPNHQALEVAVSGKKPTPRKYKTKTELRRSYRGNRKVQVRVD